MALSHRSVNDNDLRRLIDALPVLVSHVDKSQHYVQVNKAYEEWCGVSRREIEGRHLRDVLGEVAYEVMRPHVEEVLAGRVHCESNVPYEAGGGRWASVMYIPRFAESGEVEGFVALITDVTMRERAQEELRDSLKQLRTLAALAPVGIFRTDSNGDCLFVNERWCQFAGMTEAEAAGRGWACALHPDDRERVLREWYDAAAARAEFKSEYRFRAPDGRVTWLQGRATALTDEQRQLTGYLGTVTDITDRVHGQLRQQFLAYASALLSSSLDYETTLSNVARLAVPHLADWCAIFVRQDDGTPRRVAVAHRDPAKVEFVERLLERYPPDPGAEHGSLKAFRTGKPSYLKEIPDSLLVQAAKSDEHLRLLRTLMLRSSMAVPIRARDETLGVLTLVTAESGRTLMPEDLAFAEELAWRAGMAIDNAHHYRQAREALLAREEFLSIASHELKTPLSTLLLDLEGVERMLRAAGERPVHAGEMAAEIAEAARKGRELSALVNEQLDVSRLSAGKLKLDLREMDLVECARTVIDRAGGNVELVADRPMTGRWDRRRLEQVLTNLLSNAVKYGGEGAITVRIEGAERSARIAVVDRGAGIAPEDLERIFKPFERAARTRHLKGWGLGLHIVRQIVEAHGGTVRVESEVGKGSTFTVELPR